MAPTEILAKQHHQSLTQLLEPLGMRVGLLTGSMTAKGKRETYEKLNSGEIDLIVGTHALLSEGVQFKDLALVITDEQIDTRRCRFRKNPDCSSMLLDDMAVGITICIYGTDRDTGKATLQLFVRTSGTARYARRFIDRKHDSKEQAGNI